MALLITLVGCAGPPKPDDEAAVKEKPAASTAVVGGEVAIVLDSATIARIGLRTVVVARSERAPEIELAAQVVEDPGATSTIRTGVGGRLTEAEGHPWPHVGDRLTAGEAIAQVGDARPVLVPRGGTVLRLLAQPGELLQPGQELLQLIDFRTALVRVVLDPAESAPPAVLSFSAPAGARRLTGKLQGPATEADPITRSPAWLYRLAGDEMLRPGIALLAYRRDPRGVRGGVLVPSDAVVQWDALTWAFVERAAGQFVRVRVPTELAVPGGWLVQQGLAPGDRVVVTGAGQLLSEEFRARISVGQEVGE
ncbi:MAG: HlyD family efflux transporter periplasmic adaptor subunit [Gemmatimonadota bacterium]